MNILIIGSGGREHVFAWKLRQSPLCEKLFIAPGNAGTADCGINVNIGVTEFDRIRDLIISSDIGMVVVGPEEPLVKGLVDYLITDPRLGHLHIIGPGRAGAQLEGSKSFAKAFMIRNGIPTAAYSSFSSDSYQEGVDYIKKQKLPVVLKADGLAAGKGVLICGSHIEALAEFELMLLNEKFGAAGTNVVVEEFLEGTEISVFALTDGKDYVLLPEAKDYKRIGEGDTGLNTGGMGAVSPIPFFDELLRSKVISRIIEPTIRGLQAEGIGYKGFIFFGLMISGGEPFVIEYNCRMGDPETQAVLPRLRNDLAALFLATAEGKLSNVLIDADQRAAAAVVAVSEGYPGEYETGKVILGLQDPLPQGSMVFQAGTRQDDGDILSTGGRVLAVTSLSADIESATRQSLSILDDIYYENIYYRTDIGHEFISSHETN